MVHVTNKGLGQLSIRMKVDAGSYLGGGLASPTAVLIHGIVNLDEVDVGEVDMVALLIHSPVNLEAGIIDTLWLRHTGGIVGKVIDITPVKEILHIVSIPFICAHVDGIATQFCSLKGHGLLPLQPQGPIGLGVIGVAAHVPAGAVGVHIVAGPADVGRVVEIRIHAAWRSLLALVGPIIGDLIVVLSFGMMVLAACQLIPLVAVAGNAVTVHVHAHHDDSRLAAAAMSLAITDEGVALNLKVIGVHIDHRMVKSNDHIAAISAQRNHALGPDRIDAGDGLAMKSRGHCIDVAADGRLASRQHTIHGLTHPAHRHGVDKLPWSRAVLIDPREPGMVGPQGRGRHNRQSDDKYAS